jgi:hypothetical protein
MLGFNAQLSETCEEVRNRSAAIVITINAVEDVDKELELVGLEDHRSTRHA